MTNTKQLSSSYLYSTPHTHTQTRETRERQERDRERQHAIYECMYMYMYMCMCMCIYQVQQINKQNGKQTFFHCSGRPVFSASQGKNTTKKIMFRAVFV
jgi:hypothetical protein